MSKFTPLARGIRLRCAACDGGGLFESWFRIHPSCPTCGLDFQREDGYWLGAMVVSFAVTEAIFGIFFVGSMVATWPDVPWLAIGVIGVLLNLAVPILFARRSRTIWMGIDQSFFPPTVEEEATAIARRAVRAEARNVERPDYPHADRNDA